MALLKHKELNDPELTKQIVELYKGYDNEIDYFIKKLAYGLGRIASTFYPNEIIVRFSDFKSNEYCNLLGGKHFEPHEENPMIGWRGASRYYSREYQKAFILECKAIKFARENMNMSNILDEEPLDGNTTNNTQKTLTDLIKDLHSLQISDEEFRYKNRKKRDIPLINEDRLGNRKKRRDGLPSNWL